MIFVLFLDTFLVNLCLNDSIVNEYLIEVLLITLRSGYNTNKILSVIAQVGSEEDRQYVDLIPTSER